MLGCLGLICCFSFPECHWGCSLVVFQIWIFSKVVTAFQGGTAILPCHVIDTNDDLTQISWQRKTREKPRNDNFLTVLPREGPQFVNGGDDRFKHIGNFNDKNSSSPCFPRQSYFHHPSCMLIYFSAAPLLVPPFTNIKDSLPTLGTEEVLFATCTAAGSKPPAEVRWLTDALGEKVRTTTNSTQYDNDTTTTVSSQFGVPTREINGHQVQCLKKLITEALSYFSRSGQLLPQPGVKADGAKLQLLSLTSDLNGLYQCEASNRYGKKYGQLYVHVASGEVTSAAAWVLFGVLLSLNAVGDAVWYFYKLQRYVKH
uniref:Ig-like domain-containing protein n=1 Tax=Haplochromis burtoni TaxID=8153 RepID=A0A3Q2W4G2_HAPBU